MNINDIVNANKASNYLGTQSSAQSTTNASSAAPAGLLKAEKRIQTQVDTTTAQLSSFGQLKSSVSNAQLAAQALGKLSTTATGTAVKTAASDFVNAFNAAINTAKASASVPGETLATQSAGRTSKDLLRNVSGDAATSDALKKVGISVNASGNLVLDATKFAAAQKADPAALRATLTKLGQQVDKTAAKELATDGNVGISLSSLNHRSAMLKSQQAALSALTQTATTTPSKTSTGMLNYGISAYQNS